MDNPTRQRYTAQIEMTRLELEKFSKKENYLPVIRLIFFLIMLVLFYKFLVNNSLFFIYGSLSSFFTFLLLTSWDNHIKSEIKRRERLVEILSNEIKSIDGDFSPFDPGKEFSDPDHSYAYDLDLFGEKSLFHCLNRSVTIFGKNRLADYFKYAYSFKNLIQIRQKSILELSGHFDFRQKIQLVFYGQKSTEKERLDLIEWLSSSPAVKQKRLFNILRYTLPVITNSLIILSLMGLVAVQFPIMMVILQLFIVSVYGRKTIEIQSKLTTKVETISKYAQFLLLIEKGSFKSEYLNELQQQLSFDGDEPPSKIIKQLFTLLNWMDANLNILAALLLNGLFLFNLHVLASVDKWKLRYHKLIPLWFDTIGEIDALVSLANFTANNPEFIFPEVVEERFIFEAADLGHPLISRDECVTNDISISGWNQYCIITGANMSGKSTFLRTVGCNYVLAMLGAPVFAKKFIFCPVMLHSSIRTNDSLARKESFFYAELKRLKGIISELESGQRTFILLDEILKGTNSKDKQAGSIALLEQLIKYQSVGLIATHDLILGDLIVNYPENIHNLCFEIHILDDKMNIDYKLQEGVCQNLNATFLMKKMGILIDK